MSKSTLLHLLGFAPDADPSIVGVLTACSGAVPSLRGMKGAPSPADTPLATLAATCQGAAVLSKLDGTTRFIAGTPKNLYEAGSSTWSDVSRASTYTTSPTGRWRFAQQENVTFAANGADTIQASVSTGAFSCVAGAPIAAIVETVGKFVFALNTSANVHGVQWSALGDYTSWPTSIATQAGSDTLEETSGPITGGKRFGNSLVVFKKNSMFLGIYNGPPTIWQFALIPGTAGALSQEVVINIGTPENPKLIFMGEDDFYLYDGASAFPIGTNRVKNTVFGSLIQTRFAACAALHDARNNLVYFYYPSVDSVFPNKSVVYNYRTDRWGADVDRLIEAATDYVAPPISYGGLGSRFATYGDLPALSYGTGLVGSTQMFPAFFNTSHVLKTLTGVAGETSVTTGDIGDDSAFTLVTRVWPRFIKAPTTARLANYYKNTSGGTLTPDATTTITDGRFDFTREARWHRLQFLFTGDWELASFKPEWETSGTE